MHEMSLCESLVQLIEEQAQNQDFARVKQVWLEVGALAMVDISALRFCYDVVCSNTLAQNSTLNIINLPGEALCFECGQTVAISSRQDLCPKCGAAKLLVHGGDEFRLKEMEVV